MHSINITSAYAALLGIMFLIITMRIVFSRHKNIISLGDGNNRDLGKLIRGHGNFAETVPLALVLMLMLELQGSSAILLHSLGIALIAGRVLHYLRVTSLVKIMNFRVAGMGLTLMVITVASIRLLIGSIF